MSLVFRRCIDLGWGGEPLYWCPNNAGYTSDVAHAGLYEKGTWTNTEHSVEVDPRPLIEARVASIKEELALLEVAAGKLEALRVCVVPG